MNHTMRSISSLGEKHIGCTSKEVLTGKNAVVEKKKRVCQAFCVSLRRNLRGVEPPLMHRNGF